MREFKLQAAKAMFDKNPDLISTMAVSDGFVDFGASMIACKAISCPGREKHESAARSRVGRAAFCQGWDIKKKNGREILLQKDETKAKTNGEAVWTNVCSEEEKSFYEVAISALMYFYGMENELLGKYIEKLNNGIIEKNDSFRASDEFYYSILLERKINEIPVFSEVSDDDLDIDETGKIEIKSVGELPWISEALKDIPNDFSVGSSCKGKYRLNWKAGTVSLSSGKSYDFSGEQNGLDWFDRKGYVDNPYFRDTLLRVVEIVESTYRINGLEYNREEPVNEVLADKIGSSLMRNIMLCGEPGTGKTLLMEAVSAATGIPLIVMRINEYTEADALTETVKVSEKGYEAVKSRFFWAAKFGGIFMLDDATNGRTGILFATVGGLMDEPFSLESGEDVAARHPLCLICATANVGTVSAQEMEQALNNRFALPTLVKKLPDNSFKEIIKKQMKKRCGIPATAEVIDAIVNWVYSVHQSAYALCATANAEAANMLFSLRNSITLAEKMLCNLTMLGNTRAKQEAVSAFAYPLYLQDDASTAEQIEEAINNLALTDLLHVEKI